MDKRNFNNLGDQIKDTVQDAMDSMNFDRLNHDISNSVRNALDDVNSRLRGYHGANDFIQNRNRYRHNDQNNQNNQRYNHAYDRNDEAKRRQDSFERRQDSFHRSENRTTMSRQMKRNLPGSVSGVVLQVFGYIGTTLFGIAILVMSILYTTLDFASIFRYIAIGLSPLFLLSIYAVVKGKTISNRLKRFKQYTSQIRGQSFCLIKNLASNIGRSEKYVIQDLRKMIRFGMFPEGHLDEKNTCFILDHETYQQYLITLTEYNKRQQDELEQKKQNKANEVNHKENQNKETNINNESTNEELRKTIDEGRMYIRQIKLANDAIPGEDISNKLYRLEEVTSKIFLCVEQHPEQLPELKKFMEYYLPTTLKLVSAYQEFDAQPIQGDNITTAKNEIGKTLETINFAFENLLDSLYQDAAMEVSTDITVLESLLAREGLTAKDFNITKGGSNHDK